MTGFALSSGQDFMSFLIDSAERANSAWCLELDLDPERLPEERPLQFGERLLAEILRNLEVEGLLPAALHPVTASFEAFGLEGLAVMERLLEPWRGRLPIILGARPGESARMGRAAAAAVFDRWKADAAILTPWICQDFLQPFLERLPQRGLFFVLRAPGRVGAWDLSAAPVEVSGGEVKPAWMVLARSLAASGRPGMGAVLGSGYLGDLASTASILSQTAGKPLLVFGVQSTLRGADAAGVMGALRLSGGDMRTFRVGVGAPILYAGVGNPGQDPVEEALRAARRLQDAVRLFDAEARHRTEPIRVFLVEDQGLVRRAFRGVLEHESDMVVVGETSTAEQALQEIPEARPDVVLIDLGLPGMTGLEATRRLRATGCTARLVVLSASEDFEDVVSSLQAGAHGYMHKRIHAEELVDSVRRASQGEPVIPRDMVAAYLEHQARERRIIVPLSEREQQVLFHLASGASNREIASVLNSAEGTVKTHVRNVYRKLGIGTRKQAAVCARNLGLIGS